MKKTKLFSLLASVIGAGMLLAAPAVHAATTLTVYTALEADQIKAYQAAFQKVNPDIEIKWVRDSTGIVTAKLLAEKANPQADVIWGLAATSLALLDKEGMLTPYAPQGLSAIDGKYRSAANPPAWVGMDVWASAICFNTVEAQKQGLPKPTSWADLTKPVYAGKIVMPNPASSGTGYLDVSAWLQMMGEDKGWAYMDALHKNIGQYTHSGSKPCKQAATGEFPIGIAFEYRAVKTKKEGAPIDVILPAEGLGWDIEATAIVKGSKHLEAAKKLADFSASKEAMALYEKNFAVVAIPGVAKPDELLPADYEKRLIKNDFTWASTQRDRILTEWSKRYESKSEKKQ
ncbi:putative 2-aminoethylphosphonate ABC transporter substrate-binding protein [Herbaspirillum sp. BH-1]|uniref:Iron(III) transport system substrate-binding protein n=2 Tax=Oxalobacteraceae TaxID=75682 RepID=A0ABU1P8N5_9BURK|nr:MULTISPECIES: putative 2-aminoethylphosphonate ABC transporter substrate-binding protein [Herbaspirillum]MDR6582267.1 iron(III) transport system substrate-binding protein [Herbaspirillum frisingense]PLY59213.1 putative 2-aminoethylphosphonate ABC transporter substrate-binding protein [Herbaspirillum sp. BH-1]